MTFKSSMDKTAIIITIMISILFVALIILKFILPLAILLIAIYLICWSLKPLRYEISDDEIIIRRWIKSVHINKSEIESLKFLDKNELAGSLRTFGVGGLFGWYGKFTNKELGDMTWYITRRDKPILIMTKMGKNILISPDDADGFSKQYHNLRQHKST